MQNSKTNPEGQEGLDDDGTMLAPYSSAGDRALSHEANERGRADHEDPLPETTRA